MGRKPERSRVGERGFFFCDQQGWTDEGRMGYSTRLSSTVRCCFDVPLLFCFCSVRQRDAVMVIGPRSDGKTGILKKIDGKDGIVKYAGGNERDIIPLQVQRN